MAEGKRPFILYTDLIHTVEKMPRDLRGDLFLHILKYVNDQDPETHDLILEIAFEPIKQSLKRDLVKYRKICERNRNNGLLGGRPPNNPKKPKKPNGLIGNPKNPDEPDIYDNDIYDIEVNAPTADEGINKIYNQFVKEVKEGNHKQSVERWYMQLRIRNGSLQTLLEDFQGHLLDEKKLHKNTLEFKKHFKRWLDKLDSIGKLNDFKK